MSENSKEHLIGAAFTAGLFLPHEGLLVYANPLLVVLLACLFFVRERATIAQYLFAAAIALSLLANINTAFDHKTVSRTLMFLLLFLLFPFAGNVKIKNIYLYAGLGFIFVSQAMYIFSIQPLISFFANIYPYNEIAANQAPDFLSRAVDPGNFTDHRLGGLFRNPNICAQALNFLLSVYLIENKKEGVLRLLPFILVSSYAVYLTGSRTGFVIAALSVGVWLFIRWQLDKRWLLIALPVLALSGFYIGGLGSKYRTFNIAGGLENSLGYKWEVFTDYLAHQPSTRRMVFGAFDDTNRKGYPTAHLILDSEYGNLICLYGFAGVMAIAVFYLAVLRRTENTERGVFILLLWCVSSTILFSYRMSFVYMLLLSKYCGPRRRLFINSYGIPKLKRYPTQ